MNEACFICVKDESGKVQLRTLSRIDTPQFEQSAYKSVFSDAEKDQLRETGTLRATKEMKNRIITMPIDAIKIPDYIYGKRLDDTQKQTLAGGGQAPINDIQRKNNTMLSGSLSWMPHRKASHSSNRMRNCESAKPFLERK